jgi:hypothetical protein
MSSARETMLDIPNLLQRTAERLELRDIPPFQYEQGKPLEQVPKALRSYSKDDRALIKKKCSRSPGTDPSVL